MDRRVLRWRRLSSLGLYTNGRGTHYLKVQVTQSGLSEQMSVLRELASRFGGSVGQPPSRKRLGSAAWQVSSECAAKFLREIAPYTVLKRHQITLALYWWDHQCRSCPRRELNGRISATCQHRVRASRQVAELLREMKSKDIDEVMAAQADLVTIEHRLHQILNYKGA